MSSLSRLMRATPFSRQLSVVIAMAVLSLALALSLAASWQGNQRVRELLLAQGLHTAESLARQSKLALIYDAAENAASAVQDTLALPDVVALEIRHASGRLLLGSGGPPARPDVERPASLRRDAYLEDESAEFWRFVAPVRAGEASGSPFELTEQRPQILGYVRLTQSKSSLAALRTEMIVVNFAVAFLFAFLLLEIVRRLTARLTRPLDRLSSAMTAAEAGTGGVRAVPAGPKDIVDMAQAFNSMMTVLEDRERQLRIARDDALRFARLKAEFAATVSHEIRTPLNGVVGTLDILMASDLPAKQRQFVEIAWDSSQYLLDLINNILDFSRLEAGKLELDRSDFAVAQLVEDVIALVSPQAMLKGLDLGYLVSPEVPARLQGDPRRLRQVLLNLAGNAIKFTEAGHVAIRVGLTGAAQERAGPLTVQFDVVDTGIGVAPDAQAAIFDSFTQADPSTTRHFGGSGLGLAICKQLVGLMGGEIGLASEPDRGSRFWFKLPLERGSDAAATVVARATWKGLRVLVADDSEIARSFLEQTLTAWGFQCRTLGSGDAALAELDQARARGAAYDLLLVDAACSAGDGENLALRLRREGSGDVRLVLMTRHGGDGIPAAARPDARLAKPLRQEKLLETVIAAIGTGAAPSPVPAPVRDDVWVLVVEDNRSNRIIARGMLALLGCRAELAESGQEALLAFRRRPWDLILMDCAMPGMDGFEVTAAIRALEDGGERRTPIIAMTANVQASDVEKCLASGMDEHLGKPLTLEQLSARLRRWLPHVAPRPGQTTNDEKAAGTSDAPVDPDYLQKLREVLGPALDQAIRPFLDDMPDYLEAVEQAAAAGDGDGLRRAAHAIRGAAGNLGAWPLAGVARLLEDQAQSDRLGHADELLSRARAEYALVREALLAQLEQEQAQAPQGSRDGGLVLVVDDDRSTRSALRHALQRSGFAVEEAGDGRQALDFVAGMRPDVVLMDAMMPGMDGFTACARLQETPSGKEVPVLMITALDDNQSIHRAFSVGASDYIAKPLNLAVVSQRVRRVIEANRAERHVRHLAFSDALTGLPNRVTFAENLGQAIARAEGSGQALAVLFLDLDRFKFVNDTLGHEIGDRLLKAVASRLRYCVRSSDCVARLGGDEFTVLLDELAGPGLAAQVAEKIGRSLAAAFDIDGQEIFVSASIGISVFPHDGADVSTLLRHADAAMYRAKRGSGGVQFYEPGMEASISAHLRLDSSLRRALERAELLVYYQPKADARSGRITGMEALVRWQHPERGLVPPMDFIPLAEENGLIVPIGEWVLRTACAQAREWLEAGATDLAVAVNISGVQLQEPGFADLVAAVLTDTGLEPRHLTLEITESVLMEHAREAVATLHRLKSIGLRLEIDDFGTGYSSLAYLKRFPVDALKVDRNFTRDMTSNADDAAIVTGIIALAHSLRLQVVAEGVENAGQRDFLVALDCDTIQGYYLAEPLPAAEFARRILLEAFPHIALPADCGGGTSP